MMSICPEAPVLPDPLEESPALAIREVALAAHATLDLDVSCRSVLEGLATLLPSATGGAIYLPLPDSDLLEARASSGDWAASRQIEIDSDHAAARAFRGDGTFWTARDDRTDVASSYAALQAGGRIVGVLAAELPAGAELVLGETLVALAVGVARALANAVIHEVANEARGRMADIARRKASLQVETELYAHGERLLNDLHAAIHESAQPEQIVQLAVPILCSALRASRCIGLLAADGEYRDFASCEPDFPFDASEVLWETTDLVQQVERGQRMVVIREPRELREFRAPCLEVWEQPTSLFAVPAVYEQRICAIFVFHHCGGPRGWTEPELDLARRAAAQVATALNNARLYQVALASEQFQRTLVELQSTVTCSRLSTILKAVARHGMTLLGADGAYVWQVDKPRQELFGVVGVGHCAERFVELRCPLNRGRCLALAALKAAAPVVSNDAATDPRVNQRVRRRLDFQAALAVPLQGRDEPVGVVVFTFRRAGTLIDAGQVRQAQVIVTEAATAIENARLHAEMRRRAAEWQILWEIGQTITQDLDADHVVQTLVEGTAKILRVKACSLLLRDRETGAVSLRGQLGLSLEHAETLRFERGVRLPTALAVDGAPRVTPDLSLKGRYPAVAARDGLRSMLSVPLVEPDETTVGALTVYGGPDRSFSIEDLEAFTTLASFGVAALANASRYDRERQIARAFQRLQTASDEPGGGLESALHSLPALGEADIGGDYYDMIPLEDGRLVVAVGDVCGKGLQAAVQTQSLRWMMRTLVAESPDPVGLMTRLNRLLCRYTPPEGFVSLFYGLFDPNRRRLRYANGGHLPPLLHRADSGAIEAVERASLVLGAEPTADYEEGEVELSDGDALVLYSDGITDARVDGRVIGIEGLVAYLETALDPGGAATPSAESIADELFRSVRRAANNALRDDATILVLRAAPRAVAPTAKPIAAAGPA
jgi:GAF domain-containing protein